MKTHPNSRCTQTQIRPHTAWDVCIRLHHVACTKSCIGHALALRYRTMPSVAVRCAYAPKKARTAACKLFRFAKRIPLAMWKPGPCGVGRKKVPCTAPRAPVSRNYPCECPSCIGYNSVLPNLFPTDNMSARTSTLGRWSTRQRQRPALPEAELGWQIQEK